ncbi:hypothetical protein FRB91_000180 [Serendipita sp. 411]|nr:hypothetical protein FRB91_000180 [Serendipita sp. 411]KAG9052061.1 hypothetical protein FS842_010552 [Serendipita sp. 407]
MTSESQVFPWLQGTAPARGYSHIGSRSPPPAPTTPTAPLSFASTHLRNSLPRVNDRSDADDRKGKKKIKSPPIKRSAQQYLLSSPYTPGQDLPPFTSGAADKRKLEGGAPTRFPYATVSPGQAISLPEAFSSSHHHHYGPFTAPLPYTSSAATWGVEPFVPYYNDMAPVHPKSIDLAPRSSLPQINTASDRALQRYTDDGVVELEGVVITSKPVYRGSYSTVYKGTWGKRDVAIKVIETVGSIRKTRRKLRRESQIWANLRHPNVIPLYGLCLDAHFGEYGALVSPWCTFGNSEGYINQLSNNPRERIRLLTEVAQGMDYLHTHNPVIVHGDLKPLNILIDHNRTAKLCDFGLIRIIREEGDTGMTTTSPYMGTVRYLSQELVIDNNPVPTVASDSHAFGCVGLRFAYMKQPHADHNSHGRLYTTITNGDPPAMQPPSAKGHTGHIALWYLLEKCWELEPNNRPTSWEIYEHLSSLGDIIIEALEDIPLT